MKSEQFVRFFMMRFVVLLLLSVFPTLVDAAFFGGRDADNNFGSYADREDVRAFVRAFLKEGVKEAVTGGERQKDAHRARGTSLNEAELLDIFRQAEYKQNIIDAISRPAEKTLLWDEYQDIFLNIRRRLEGIRFYRQYEDVLDAAYRQYGVPPEIIVAIIGVETSYGRIKGNYRVLDALATLSFDYPPRAEFFRQELKHFILLAQEENQKITELKGSYAGAMGWGQFIPSSFRHYAVDFDADGIRDIWNNPVDAIGSIANYLYQHGWQRDGLITFAVDGVSAPDNIFNVSLKPTVAIATLSRHGVTSPFMSTLSPDELTAPMKLSGKQGKEYWLGLHNFYMITRYNRNKLYAMAVYQLSDNLRRAVAPDNPGTP